MGITARQLPYRLSHVIEKMSHASLADIGRWVSHFPSIPPTLSAPPSLSSVEMVASLFPEVEAASAEACRLEFFRDDRFFTALNQRMIEKRRRHVRYPAWAELLYMAIRFLKPRIVVETGVFDGVSSAIILRALEENAAGKLLSIDLPAREAIVGSTSSMPDTTLPPHCDPGWVVPEYLRGRYNLELGDSKELLPSLLRRYPTIDGFFHDSLHTFEHMYFEYATAWPHLSDGGLLLSDDIFWSRALDKFCKETGKQYVRFDGFGAVRK
jgi:predicted O-methyltransferase YrrM